MVPRWKQLKCPSTADWTNKLWYIHRMRYYSATQCSTLMISATLWMNLKCILLSERSHLKVYILYDSMYATFWKSYNYGEKNRNIGCQGLEIGGVSTTKGHPLYTYVYICYTYVIHNLTIMKCKSVQVQQLTT